MKRTKLMKNTKNIKLTKNLRKLSGFTLIEAVMAFCILGLVVPASLSALGSVLMADIKINETAVMVSSSEWWFSRLTFPVCMKDINSAPQTDPHGKISFKWETENLSDGAVKVTLSVYGRLPGSVYVVSRIF